MLQHNTSPRHADDNRTLSALFEAVLNRHAGQTVRVGTLLEAMHERGFGVLLIFFCLPLCIPIPKPPPIDTILGLPLFYLCIQMIMGQDKPVLPRSVTERKISVDWLLKAFTKGRKWLERLEKLFHPRLTGIHERQMGRIYGCMGIILTASVLIPIPFTNTLPSLCMLVMAMGLISRDNLAVLIGGIVGIVYVAALATGVTSGAHFIFDWIKG